ncbi:FadR/GntR family transcriptional regulator [Roseivivax sp. CAU 1761]
MVGRSAVEDIRETLRREILEKYSAGDLLPTERDLAERFDVSRNTIRETIIHLEAFDLVRKTKRGPMVTRPDFGTMFRGFTQFFGTSAETFTDVLNFRRINETGAAPLMAAYVTEADLAEMEAANVGMREALTTADAAGQDFRFHLALVDAAHNEVLSRMYRVMAEPMRFYLEVGKSRRPATDVAFDQHARIIAALRAGEAEMLSRALAEHFQHSSDTLAEWLADRAKDGATPTPWPSRDAAAGD